MQRSFYHSTEKSEIVSESSGVTDSESAGAL